MRQVVLLIMFIFLASPVPVEGNSYIKFAYNYNRPGGDYTNFQAINVQECAHKCEISKRCQAFDFYSSDNSCWLKNKVYPLRRYKGAISGMKQYGANEKE